jgi:hypothetical protein
MSVQVIFQLSLDLIDSSSISQLSPSFPMPESERARALNELSERLEELRRHL